MLARALLHTSLVLWMTGLTLQGGVRPQVSTLARMGIPVKDASLGMGGAKPASYSALGALGARGYGGKPGKVAGRYPGAHLGGVGYRGLGAGRAALKQGAGYGAYGVGLGAGVGAPLGAGLGNGMGLGVPHAGKRGAYGNGNGYGPQPGYGGLAGVGYAGVRPGFEAHYFPGQSAKGPKPGWPAAYLGGFGRAGGGHGGQNLRGTFRGRGPMENQGHGTSLRTLLPQPPKVKGRSHDGGAAPHHQRGGGGGLWTHTPSPGEHVKSLDPAERRPSADRLGQPAPQAQAGTDFSFQDEATLASRGGPLPHRQPPLGSERNPGPVLPVPPQAQGSSGSSPHHRQGPQNPGYHDGTTGLLAAAGEQSKVPGSQVLVSPDGHSLRPAAALGQEDQNYGLSFASSHSSSSSGYYGVAFEQGQRNPNHQAAATDKEAFKAQSSAGESVSLLALLTSGDPGPAAREQASRDPGSRPLSVDSAAVQTDQGLVAGGGQLASSLSRVDPVLTTGSTRSALRAEELREKRKQGPDMGYGAGTHPGAALGVAGYGAGLGQGGYPLAAGAGKFGGAANLGHGGFPQGGVGKPTDFGDGAGAYGAGGLGVGNGYGYGYNMGGNGYGPGGAGSVPVGAGVYGDAQAMGLGTDSGLGALGGGIEATGGKYGGGVGQLSNGAAPVISAGLEGDGSFPYSPQQLALGAEAAAAKSASKFGMGAGYGAQQAGFAAQAGQDSYGVPHGKYGGVNGFLGNGYKG